MRKRVRFTGVIEGGVIVRPGESEDDAILRAQEAIQSVLDRYAKSYYRPGESAVYAPVVGLEPL